MHGKSEMTFNPQANSMRTGSQKMHLRIKGSVNHKSYVYPSVCVRPCTNESQRFPKEGTSKARKKTIQLPKELYQKMCSN